MNNDFTRNIQITLNTSHQNKSLYGEGDQRLNLHELESTKLETSLIATVKQQAKSIACLVRKDVLIPKEDGWQFHPMTPTLRQNIERQFQAEEALFGEQESFKDELAPGFGTAFLVEKRLALTAAHCICVKDSDILDQKAIEKARVLFGFHEIKEKPSDYFFAKNQVYQIKKVVAHQFTRIRDRNHSYTECSDWALLELDEEVPFTPLRMNMTEKVADKIELYMLGHPSGLPLKFTGGGFVQGNSHKDFFECNLDAFGGNSGSFVAAVSTKLGSGILCSGDRDFEITDNYKKMGQKRIQACRITESQIMQRRIGDRLENCQRIDSLRFLHGLLGLEGPEQPGSPALIVKSLQDNYKSRNTIPRLLHSALLIEEVYTELVLLEQGKEEKATFEEQRINSWEDVQGSKTPIELKNLFNTGVKVQKKFLILGRAGIGKSILCQYIAYQWSQGKMWPGKFDALFWVPLRKLQHAHSSETLASFLFRICCQEHEPSLYPKDIADYLKQNGERILFVLDGLDEVALVEGSLQKGIVDELLAFPHWLLTSRPHAAASICTDATIENVGFASKTIDAYIQKSFPDNSQAIIQTVRQNSIILGLCHIPINIELVCSILQKSKGNISFIRSMSGLYEELTLILQRRFLDKLGKPSAWHWEPEDIENDGEISLIFKSLEAVAWEGMREKALFFSFNQGAMKKIYCSSYPVSEAEKREPLFKSMCASGFLQSTGNHTLFLHNEYSFLHLTFQEFFAARYLARLLHDNPKEGSACIQEVKFNPRYKVVMWFTAGLLRKEGGDFRDLNAFFEMLDTPKDLVGLYGALLKIRCLEECGWQRQLQKIKSYEEEVQFWLEKMDMKDWRRASIRKHLIETFEISPQGAKKLFIPKLNSCFASSDSDIRQTAIKNLGQVGHADPQTVIPVLLEALHDTESDVRYFAVKALKQIGQANPEAIIPPLLGILKDRQELAKEAALQALGQIAYLNPEAVIPPLLAVLKDTDEIDIVRKAALQALGQVELADPQAIITALIESLNDKKDAIRTGAANALGQISHADPRVVIPPLTESLKDEHYQVREAVAKSLGQIGQVNPEAVISTLLGALQDKHYQVREAATNALGQIGQVNPEAVISTLLESLKDQDELVRQYATNALGQIGHAGPKVVIHALLGSLKDENWRVRADSAEALGKVGHADPQAIIPSLLESLKDEDWASRREAAEALGQLGHADLKTVIPALVESLKDKEMFGLVRAAAAEALGKIGHADPQAVIPALLKALKDEQRMVRAAVAEALGQVGHADPQAIIPDLLESLEDKEWNIRDSAAKALQKYDLSLYLKSHSNILHNLNRGILLTSTPLRCLIACYKEDQTQSSVYSAAIAKKCIEENLPIFQIRNTLCCYEQSKLYTLDFPDANPFTIQIEDRVPQYPNSFIFLQKYQVIPELAIITEICSIQ
jgi:HEAT repeat protein/V8-like Glu-specific endopeptidase